MPSTFKTPGVYIQEVSNFPPSVAPVATAIPAFIGYTKKAEKNGEGISNTPTKIDSFVEFVEFFGGPPPRDVSILINNNNQFISATSQADNYYLYDSLRLFFDNGGGVCYVVSVGGYTENVALGDPAVPEPGLLVGLKALEKYDEPTLLVFPDATTLDGTNLYRMQQQALAQCAKLQDRFAILDPKKAREDVFDDLIQEFRDNIGINNLKYGATYAPWLRTNIPAGLKYRDLTFEREGSAGDSLTILQSLTTDKNISQLIYDLNNASSISSGIQALNTQEGGLLDSDVSNLEGQMKKLADALNAAIATLDDSSAWADPETELQDLYNKFTEVINAVSQVLQDMPAIGSPLAPASSSTTVNFKLASDIEDLVESVRESFEILVNHHWNVSDLGGINLFDTGSVDWTNTLAFFGITNLNTDVDSNEDIDNAYFEVNLLEAIIPAITTIADDAASSGTPLADIEAAFPDMSTDDLATLVQAAIDATVPAPGPGSTETWRDAVGGNANTIIGSLGFNILQSYIDDGITDVVDIDNPELTAHIIATMPNIQTQLEGLLNAASEVSAASGSPADIANAIRLVATTIRDQAQIAANAAIDASNTFTNMVSEITSAAQNYEDTFDSALRDSLGLYKTLLNRAEQELMILPPSAAIAGIYTFVDNTRGVWKAPANVSLSSVIGPLVVISASDQENLNVDVNAGKSVNAIRSFTGKGILVWGARTLAGNDNEWRYVPVRRFFNFAEESIKKATEQFVFEPNDANTWVRIKAMIENFLILQWRAGALAGAKPEQAFFVKVGLGETMTSLDILEGRMIVEIGMAVVRPAEFIILRFSHKMQES